MNDGYEHYIARREGAQNTASDDYFTPRASVDEKRFHKVFSAGFERAYDLRESELTALREKNAELQSALFDQAKRDILLTEMAIGNGSFSIGVEGGAASVLVESLAKQFNDSDAINYLELSFTSQKVLPGKMFVVTIQTVDGKTPHQLRAEAEAKCAELQRQLDEAAKQEPVGKVCEDGMTITWDWANSGLDAGDYVYAKPINLPALIEQAKAEEREAALKIMRRAAAALAHAAESNPLYQDAYNEIDAAIRARKP